MAFIATAIGLGAVSSLASGVIGANAAGNAAQTQAQAATYATDVQKQMFDEQMNAAAPWRNAGISALYGPGGLFVNSSGGSSTPTTSAELAQKAYITDRVNQIKAQVNTPEGALYKGMSDSQLQAQAQSDWETAQQKLNSGNLSPADQYLSKYQASNFTNQADQANSAQGYQLNPDFNKTFTAADMDQYDPGYQFRLQQGQQALERSAAARGGLQSGGTLKALTNYAQDYASNEYQNAYSRFTTDQTNRFNRLTSLAGMGQTSNAGTANLAASTAGNIGNIAVGSANAQGAAGIAGANAWTGAMSGLSGMGNTWMNYTMANKYLGSLGGGTGGTSPMSIPGYSAAANGEISGSLTMPEFG